MFFIKNQKISLQNRNLKNSNKKLYDYYQNSLSEKEIHLSCLFSEDFDLQHYTADTINDAGTKLIIRITEKDCQSCLTKIFYEINEFVNYIGTEKVEVWGSFSDENHLKALTKYQLGAVENYKNVRELPLPAERMELPYVFLLDKSSRVKLVYAFDKSNPDEAHNYFTHVGSYFETDLKGSD